MYIWYYCNLYRLELIIQNSWISSLTVELDGLIRLNATFTICSKMQAILFNRKDFVNQYK